MDKGHIYILQTFKNLEDQLLVDNFPIGKEIAKQIPLAAELIDALFDLKSKADPECEAVKRINEITANIRDPYPYRSMPRHTFKTIELDTNELNVKHERDLNYKYNEYRITANQIKKLAEKL